MEKNIKLVIFDLDGTLVDAYKAVSSSLNHALTTFGFDPIPDEVVTRSVGWGEKILVSKFVPQDDLEKVLSVYRQHHRSALKSGTSFLPGAKALLDSLKEQGYILSIASNRPSRFTHIILKQLKIIGHFDSVICGDMVEHPKPAADVLLKTLKKFDLKAEEAIYVGDMGIDVQTGQNAHVKTVVVTTGSYMREELQPLNPYAIIDQIGDLSEILDQL